jgi:hypothetical protein
MKLSEELEQMEQQLSRNHDEECWPGRRILAALKRVLADEYRHCLPGEAAFFDRTKYEYDSWIAGYTAAWTEAREAIDKE